MGKSCIHLVGIASLAVFVSLAAPSTSTAQRTNWTAEQLSNPFPAARSEQELIESLRTGEPAEKAIACKQLAIYGNKSAVPELAKLLSNEELASWSRIALEAIPDPSADEALIAAASTLQGRLLVGTINSIGVRRSANAVEHLTTRLKDADAQVASAAAVALGRIGSDAATKTLRQSLAGGAPEVRSAVAEGCILCAEKLMKEGKHAAAVELYDEIRRADIPQQRVLEATRGAILARGEQGIPLLVEQLKSPEKAMFRLGLSTARELPGNEVSEALAAELASASPERAALIVSAIGDRDDAALPLTVLLATLGGDSQVRLAAIQAVGKRGDANSVPSLLEIAANADAELAEAATTALTQLPGENVNEELARRLSSATGKSLEVLIETVGQRRIDAAAELVKVLGHSDEAIRRAAVKALGATAGPKELAVLITEANNAKSAADAEMVAKALETASVRMPDREATAAQLSAAMEDASTENKARLIRILGAMGGSRALATISAATQGDDEELQDVGTRVLGEWMTADAAPHLYKIASSNSAYKTRALRGYLRIARQLDIPDAQRLDMCRKALAIAERTDERSLALEAMKRCPSAESIKLATSLVDDAQLRQRAVETAIFIGEKIKNSDPAAAAAAGEKALETSPPRALAERARALTKISNRPN
jgi:HEAT repeat protein